jgi:hypothetical protein
MRESIVVGKLQAATTSDVSSSLEAKGFTVVVRSSLDPSVEADEPQEKTGEGEFSPTFRLFAGPNFGDRPVLAGGDFPGDGARFLLEAEASEFGGIAFQNCTASPTDDPEHPAAVSIMSNFCIGKGWGQKDETAPNPNTTRLSSWAFAFPGQNDVHFTCGIVRCASPPCGRCDNGSQPRRLQQDVVASGDTATATIVLYMPANATLVIASPGAEDAESPSTANLTLVVLVAAGGAIALCACAAATYVCRTRAKNPRAVVGKPRGKGSHDHELEHGSNGIDADTSTP